MLATMPPSLWKIAPLQAMLRGPALRIETWKCAWTAWKTRKLENIQEQSSWFFPVILSLPLFASRCSNVFLSFWTYLPYCGWAPGWSDRQGAGFVSSMEGLPAMPHHVAMQPASSISRWLHKYISMGIYEYIYIWESINGNIYKWESTSSGIPGIHLRSWCLDELLDDHHVESLELAVALVEGADLQKKYRWSWWIPKVDWRCLKSTLFALNPHFFVIFAVAEFKPPSLRPPRSLEKSGVAQALVKSFNILHAILCV